MSERIFSDKQHYVDWISKGHWTHQILFTYRGMGKAQYAEKGLQHFLNYLNDDCWGARWRRHGDRFLPLVAVSERDDLNPHHHAVISIPNDYQTRFEDVAPLLWSEVGKKYYPRAGEENIPPQDLTYSKFDAMDLMPLSSPEDRWRFVNYQFKHFWKAESSLFLSKGFFLPSSCFSELETGWDDRLRFGGKPGEQPKDI